MNKFNRSDRFIRIFLLLTGSALMILFFICRHLGGDDGDIYWRLDLLRAHLSAEFSMPYFTPVRCGGFHLAADAQDIIFTLYMFLSFFIPNSMWTVKITNLILSVILLTGMYQWLKLFQIKDRNVRLFTSFFTVFSGYWVVNMTQGGHVWGHGFAYTPWILLYIEKILNTPIHWTKKYVLRVLILILLFFLLINSGYYWLQVAVPILIFRFLTEIFWPTKNYLEQLKRVTIILCIGLCAVFLSWPRLGGVYEFQLKKFPRLDAPHFPMIQDTWTLLKAYYYSFFDANVIKKGLHIQELNVWWDYCDFIGILSIIPLTIGFLCSQKTIKTKVFFALFLATLYQFFLTRFIGLAEFVRHFIPLFKQIMWYWRGTGITTLFFCILIGKGIEFLFFKHTYLKKFALLLMALILFEITSVQLTQFDKTPLIPEPPFSEISKSYLNFPIPATTNNFHCNLTNLFGYMNPWPPHYSIEGASVNGGGDIYTCSQAEFYNMHDPRILGSPLANNGYFYQHKWPLFPKKDAEEFDKFIHFKQIVPLPHYLTVTIQLSICLWFLFILTFIIVLKKPSLFSLD